jgi:hypothetical protein
VAEKPKGVGSLFAFLFSAEQRARAEADYASRRAEGGRR